MICADARSPIIKQSAGFFGRFPPRFRATPQPTTARCLACEIGTILPSPISAAASTRAQRRATPHRIAGAERGLANRHVPPSFRLPRSAASGRRRRSAVVVARGACRLRPAAITIMLDASVGVRGGCCRRARAAGVPSSELIRAAQNRQNRSGASATALLWRFATAVFLHLAVVVVEASRIRRATGARFSI